MTGSEAGVLFLGIAVAILGSGLVIGLAAIRALRARVTVLEAQRPIGEGDLSQLRSRQAAALQRVAVVRYDAFADMGGRLSFSAAILNDNGTGIVISSIHARGESRTYGKDVVDGRSEVPLTAEEQQAIAAARSGKAQS